MSLLDELAKASYAATAKFIGCEATSQWDWASETGKNQSRAEALAAVERFVAALNDDTDIAEALSSLRTEAGQGQAKKGSET